MTQTYYADCPYCQQSMAPGNGCTLKRYDDFVDGIARDRLPYGAEERYNDIPEYEPPEADDNCHDCSVAPGQMHHPGCDWEECPRCRLQALGCDCIREQEEK